MWNSQTAPCHVRVLLSATVIVAFHAGANRAIAQVTQTGTVTVRVRSAGTPVVDALVRFGSRDAKTDSRGNTRLELPAGDAVLVVIRIGFDPDTVRLRITVGRDTTVMVALRAHAAELESVVVHATRGGRRVEDEPTRVEVLDHEEVEEQTAMAPGNVARFMSEAGGVRVATTSPAFGGANVRIQGLRGRYTELLSDGLPLYGLTTEGLGLLQIPPLDLQQIELIKGTASALYGPTALGGVINFVSRRPGPNPSQELLVNQTSQGGSDAALFASRPLGREWNGTLLATGSRQQRYDLNHDGWTDIPSYQRGVLRPRVYWTSEGGSSVFATMGLTAENRAGGTWPGDTVPTGVPFAEDRSTRRVDIGTVAHVVLASNLALAVRGSATGEWTNERFGAARERDERNTEFGEIAFTTTARAHELVVGTTLQREGFTSRDVSALDYAFTAPAIFLQDTWTPVEWFALTSSARLDIHNAYGTLFSPRLASLFRLGHGWTARVSGGLGAYSPTPFVDETEEIGLTHLRPITSLVAERARSAESDIGGLLGPLEVNASLYASVIDHAVDIRAVAGTTDSVQLINGSRPTRTEGTELFARYRIGHYTITGTYDYRHATEMNLETGGRRGVPLTPDHAAGLTTVWESKDDSGLGLEAFYTGRQPLEYDPYRTESKPYVIIGALARWRLGRFVIWLNGEDLDNIRQTHTNPLLLPTPGLGGRWTTDAWAPLEGAVVNLGARVSL